MTEKNKYDQLIGQMKVVIEGMDKDKWNALAEETVNDKKFTRELTTTTPTDNLPVVLRHLLPEIEINPEEAVEIAFAIGRDTTIDQGALRPLGSLLIGNLTRMREVIPESK